jgi:colanic acid/amylovoran biosynthesis glycosyltransferase
MLRNISGDASVARRATSPIIAHLAQEFPSLTMTFVYREVMALRDRGMNIDTFSIWKPNIKNVSREARHLADTTYYIFPLSWVKFLRAQFSFLITHPIKYLSTFFYVLTRPNMRVSHRRRTFLHFFYAIYIAEEIKKRGIKHVHAHFALNAATVAMIVGRILGISYSLTAHANDIFANPVMLKEKLENAEFVITISEYNKSHLQQFTSADKIHIVPYGLDLRQFAPLSGPMDGDMPVILSIGRLVEKKGFPYLIEACDILRKRDYRFRCKIVGDGPQRKTLEKMIADARLEKIVSLEGTVLQEELINYWRQATVFALPCVIGENEDRDGMPNVLIEAMALQVPVVSTSLVGIPEFIKNGESGLLAPPGDTEALAGLLAVLLDSPALRTQMGRNARIVAQHTFDLQHNVSRIIDIYRLNGLI